MQVTEHDNGRSSAEVTLILYGWDGQDTSLGTLMHGLPHRNAPRVTLVDKSTRLVNRAASFLTPRGSAAVARSTLGRRSRGGASSVGDDASSVRSAGSGSAPGTPRARTSVHQNNLQ